MGYPKTLKYTPGKILIYLNFSNKVYIKPLKDIKTKDINMQWWTGSEFLTGYEELRGAQVGVVWGWGVVK